MSDQALDLKGRFASKELDERVQRAVDNFMAGYGCCQSVVAAFSDLYGLDETLAKVKALESQEAQDFLARRLYNMTAELVMSILILRDATKAPELFEKSANVYVRMTEEDVYGKSAYIKAFQVEDLENFKAK